MKRAFKRGITSNERVTSLNLRQNRRMVAICVFLGLFRRWKSSALRCAMHNAVKIAFKRRNVSSGIEITIHLR